jgi:hypothetical protein
VIQFRVSKSQIWGVTAGNLRSLLSSAPFSAEIIIFKFHKGRAWPDFQKNPKIGLFIILKN